MFVIMCDGLYFHKQGNIIIFEDPNQAASFADLFFQYAMQRMLEEQGPFSIPQVMQKRAAAAVIPVDFDISSCKTIMFSEIEK